MFRFVCPLTVRFVVDALVNVAWFCTVREDMVVVARVEVPVTANDPVVVAFPMMTFVKLERVATRLEKKPFVEVALVAVKLLIVPVVAKSVLIVPTVVEAVLSTV